MHTYWIELKQNPSKYLVCVSDADLFPPQMSASKALYELHNAKQLIFIPDQTCIISSSTPCTWILFMLRQHLLGTILEYWPTPGSLMINTQCFPSCDFTAWYSKLSLITGSSKTAVARNTSTPLFPCTVTVQVTVRSSGSWWLVKQHWKGICSLDEYPDRIVTITRLWCTYSLSCIKLEAVDNVQA